MKEKVKLELTREVVDAMVEVIEAYQDGLDGESLNPYAREFLDYYHTKIRELSGKTKLYNMFTEEHVKGLIKDSDNLETVAQLLFEDELNYNNADKTSGQSIYREEDILELLQK